MINNKKLNDIDSNYKIASHGLYVFESVSVIYVCNTPDFTDELNFIFFDGDECLYASNDKK